MKAQKALRIAARVGLAVYRPIIGKEGYQFVRGEMDKEATEEKAAKRDAKRKGRAK